MYDAIEANCNGMVLRVLSLAGPPLIQGPPLVLFFEGTQKGQMVQKKTLRTGSVAFSSWLVNVCRLRSRNEQLSRQMF